jgi:NAD(P)-dependent dehydrogenase (short-subunit alcohol dehydrogenase family)
MPLPHSTHAPDFDLRDRVVMVTGSTGGLGQAVALACARAGATVVLHGRIVRKLEALYDQIVGKGHPQPTILPLDFAVATAQDFDNVTSSLRTQLGRLDGLVHTAALLGSLGPFEHQSFDAWAKVFRINVIAAMGLTRALLPLMTDGPDASIVFTLDTRGQMPRAYWGAYGVSKAAVGALVSTLADEWENRDNLRVNGVVPGAFRSPLRFQTHPGEDREQLSDPASLARLYLYLLAAQPKAESGSVIDAQGWLAQTEPALSPPSLASRED